MALSRRVRTGALALTLVATGLTTAVTSSVDADAAVTNDLIVEEGYLLVDASHVDPDDGGPDIEAADVLPPATAAPASDSFAPVDGKLRLRYTLVRPAGFDDLPVLFEYSGYDPGSGPDATYLRQFVTNNADPYAYLAVNLRGTGCSEGSFDFFQPAEAYDAEQVIGWVTQHDWASGKVGMLGKSYPGITQLFVAAEQPVGLDAIAPGHVFADAYRDIGNPGGIPNKGFASLWSFIARPSYEFQSSPMKLFGGELGCAHGSIAVPRDIATNPMVQLLERPYDDDLYAERSPITSLADIRTPMWTVTSWQDEQLGSRQTHFFDALDGLNATRADAGQPLTPWWGVFANGDHGTYRSSLLNVELERFLDHHLKAPNGWDETPPVRIWWETTDRSAFVSPTGDPLGWLADEGGRGGYSGSSSRHSDVPGFVTEHDSWSQARRLADGSLTAERLRLVAPTVGAASGRLTEGDEPIPADPTASSTFAATPVGGSQGVGNTRYGEPTLPDAYLWDAAPAPGTFAAFTTRPLDADKVLLGSASLDLTVVTSNPDVDLQVTMTEVRPDGREVFVQQGWLRLSHRAEVGLDRPLDEQRLRPIQAHTLDDMSPIVPGVPTRARIEIFPFGHVFRTGSQLRIWVEAPTVLPQLWSFLTPPTATAVSLTTASDGAVGELWLPVADITVPEASRALPACGTVIRQPCRPDPLRRIRPSLQPA